MKINVGLWGISGFAGQELVKILSKHEGVKITYATTSKICWGNINDVDVAFLALPSQQSMETVPYLLKRELKIIDLSGAYRLKNIDQFEEFYGLKHSYPELLKEVIYGCPEMKRKEIRDAQIIANPGCYATAIELGLLPLVNSKLLFSFPNKIVVKAISGYTGAGKGVKVPKTITPYKGGHLHQHVPEVEQELGIPEQLLFYPHIAPYPRGIEASIFVKIKNTVDTVDLVKLYKQFYRNELFIRICQGQEKAKIDDVIGTNYCDIYPVIKNSIAIVKVIIDNLGKGAASQAVQNFNILCGFTEQEGL